MKKNYFFSMLAGALMMVSAPASAQYITEAPAGGFDFTKGTDYVVIYAPDAQVTAMGSNILSNQNLDPAMEKNQFYYWVCDWEKTQFTLYDCPNTLNNSWGGSEKLNMTPLWDWGSGQFTAKSQDYDLSAITDDHILHIGFMNIGDADATANYRFLLGRQVSETEFNGFPIEVNKAVGAESGDYVGVGMAPKTNTWYYLDIPVKDLVDPNGNFGFTYNFSKPFGASTNNADIFTCGFDGATICTYTYGSVDPDTGMKKVNITKIGSAMAIDHVFLYKKSTSGIQNTVASGNEEVQGIYDLTGRRVNDYRSGVNIVKTTKGVKKVIVK